MLNEILKRVIFDQHEVIWTISNDYPFINLRAVKCDKTDRVLRSMSQHGHIAIKKRLFYISHST